MNISPISALVLLCGALSLGFCVYAWRRRSTIGASTFALFMFAVTVYILGYGMELSSLTLEAALSWNRLQYIGILTFPTLYLVFVVQYTGHEKMLTPRNVSMLFLLPALLLVAKLLDGRLGLIYSSVTLDTGGPFSLLVFTRGPLYMLVSGYNLAVVTCGHFFLIHKRRYSSHLYRMQTRIMIAAALFVYLVFLLYVLDVPLFPMADGFDYNPIAFSIWGSAVGVAIFRYRLFDLAPIARDALIEMLSDGVFVLDAQTRLVDANPVALKMFGWTKPPVGEFAGQVMNRWFEPGFFDTVAPSAKIENHLAAGSDTVYYEVACSVLKDKQGQKLGYLILAHDISERKEVEKELHELSLQDELTALTNRRGFKLLADQLISMADRMQLNVALYYLDLDRLKWINDTLGHATGDQALKDAAYTLRHSFRCSDIIARIGGDEFVILAVESNENSSDIMLRRLTDEINKRQQPDRGYQISFSVGVAHYNWNQPKSINSLLEAADRAMYEMKLAKRAARAVAEANPPVSAG